MNIRHLRRRAVNLVMLGATAVAPPVMVKLSVM